MLGRAAISGVAISGAQFIAVTIPPVPPTPDRAAPTGHFGFHEPPKHQRKKDAVLEALVPKAVEKVIAKVAVEQIAKPDRNLEAAFHRALEKKALAYRAYYTEVLRKRIEEVQLSKRQAQELIAREDEEIVVLLLLH